MSGELIPIKLVVIGDGYVGKTSILMRYKLSISVVTSRKNFERGINQPYSITIVLS